jgi:hypothetical protein
VRYPYNDVPHGVFWIEIEIAGRLQPTSRLVNGTKRITVLYFEDTKRIIARYRQIP